MYRSCVQPLALLSALFLASPTQGQGIQPQSGPHATSKTQAAEDGLQITLVGTDYPEYREERGTLRIPDFDPAQRESVDPQFLRLSLVDVQKADFLTEVVSLYQTLTTDADLPFNLNFIVYGKNNAICFDPEIPYCSSFSELNRWLRRGTNRIANLDEARSLARFVVELGMSTVYHPKDALYLRLKMNMSPEYSLFLRSINDIYLPWMSSHRTEEKEEERKTLLAKYQDRIRPATMVRDGEDFIFHGFTYKIVRGDGDLREWKVVVARRGNVEVDMTPLEKGVGELFWSFAP
ncbi:MAG: hypothetical protein ACE5HD_06930 [Acidobacteriota bacterium]